MNTSTENNALVKSNGVCFGILRHAETVWNREKRIQGQYDSPLTEAGIECGRRWGSVLKAHHWDRILTSDLGRTQHTVRLMNESLNLPVATDARLREKAWGEWEGMSLQAIEDAHPGTIRNMEMQGWNFCPPGGENRNEVFGRVREALLDAAQKWPGERILNVSHGGVIICVVYGILGRNYLPDDPAILKPRHVHTISEDNGTLAIDELNAIVLNPAP